MRKWAAIGISLVLLGGCGGKSGGPGPGLPPTGPSPVSLVGISIAPDADMLRIKATETFTATAAFSDGTSRAVEPVWASDNGAIATVTAGRATGVAPGEATISAEYQGQRAARRLRVVPDYHGQWNGEHVQTRCTDEGDWRGFCREFPNGELFLMSLALTQSRDTVNGSLDLGDEPLSVQGTIAPTGHLRLEGSFRVMEDDLTFDGNLAEWETLTLDNARMTGRFVVVFRLSGLQGSLRLDTDLRSITKTSATILTAARNGRPNGLGQRLAAALRAVRARHSR